MLFASNPNENMHKKAFHKNANHTLGDCTCFIMSMSMFGRGWSQTKSAHHIGGWRLGRLELGSGSSLGVGGLVW